MSSFKQLFAKAKQSDAYWVEKAILDFTIDLYAEMKRQGKTNSDLAAIINSSPAYITKVFKGEANFTIKSMVKLVRALNCQLHLKVAHNNYTVSWLNAPLKVEKTQRQPVVTTPDSYVSETFGSYDTCERFGSYDGSIAA